MALDISRIPFGYEVLEADDHAVATLFHRMLVVVQDEAGYRFTQAVYNDEVHGTLYFCAEGVEMTISKYRPVTSANRFPVRVTSPQLSVDSVCGCVLYDALFLISDALFGIDRLKKVWTDNHGLGTNLRQFNRLMQEGSYSELEAAALTFSGMQAGRHGYYPTRVLSKVVDQHWGHYDYIELLFEKE